MPPQQICLICLKTDIPMKGLNDSLEYFYDDFCDYKSCQKRKTLFCADCFDALNRCYLFKKQCKVAVKLLTDWDKIDPKVRKPITELSNELVNCNLNESDDDEELINDKEIEKIIKNSTRKTIKKETKSVSKPIFNEDEVKIEIDDITDSKIEVFSYSNVTDSHNNVADSHNDVADSHNDKADSKVGVIDSKTGVFDSCNYVTDSLNGVSDRRNDITDSNNKSTDNNDHELTDTEELNDDSSDDNYDDESEIVKKKSIKSTKKLLSGTRKTIKKERRNKKLPFKNYAEYEKVFDIVLFKNREEELAEFAQRKFGAYYLNAKYRCDVCFTAYRSQKLLDFHMKWHDPSAGDHSCDICSMRFRSRLRMQHHRSVDHNGRFSCKMCPLVTYHRNVMECHYKKHIGGEYKCRFCSKVFKHVSTGKCHERTAHATRHVCGACARTFVSHAGLRQHRTQVHKTSSLVETEGEKKCIECDVIFTTLHVYNLHLKNSHKGTVRHMTVCADCGKEFENRHQLSEHRREKHSDKIRAKKTFTTNICEKSPLKLTCELCNATGTYPKWLFIHMQQVHPEVEYVPKSAIAKKYLCDQCGKGFASPGLLAEHQNVHSGARPFECQQCGARFRSLVYLRAHEASHRPPARECKHCGMKFTSGTQLSNHVRSHVTDRRYKCALCGKGFVFKSTLNEHVRGVHQNIRKERKARGGRKVDTET